MAPGNRDGDTAKGDRPGEDAATISETLKAILASTPFRTSKQCRDLLRYVVEHSLAQDEESLKERIIGAEVFGRRPDYNTAEDPVVRMRAGEVRKRLALYYQELPHHAKIEIDIPTGSYRARFRALDEPGPEFGERPPKAADDPLAMHDLQPGSEQAGQAPKRAPAFAAGSTASATAPGRREKVDRRLRNRLVALILLATSAALLTGWLWSRHSATDLYDAFWNPIRSSSKGPIIYVPGNPVYLLLPEEKSGKEAVPGGPPSKLESDQTNYVNTGDAAALSFIVRALTGFKKSYDLRFSNDIAASDIRQAPIILVGAFNNPWTLEMDDRLPLIFGNLQTIHELAGARRSWTTVLDSNGKASEDYSLVTRELHSKSGGVAFTIAGLTMIGTRASAEFVTDPVRMNRALQQLPAGWEKKNVELLLHSTITNDLPTSTELTAFRIW